MNIHWKDWCWSWSSNTLATWWEEVTHWERPWCWERLKAGGEGDDKIGWHHKLNGYKSEQTLADSGRTGKPGVLQSMGSQRIRHDWATEQQPVVTLQLKYKALFHWKNFETIELLRSSSVVYLKVQIKKLEPIGKPVFRGPAPGETKVTGAWPLPLLPAHPPPRSARV